MDRLGISGGVLLAAIVLLAGPTICLGAPRSHDGGFFLRMSAGIGGGSSSIFQDGKDSEFSGAGGDINFAIGGIVAENLALHGTLFGWTASDPEFKRGGESVGIPGSFGLSALGIGMTYYVMPLNLYLSGSVGFGNLTLEVELLGLGAFNTDPGLAMEFGIGKEWWVSDRWGLGLAGGISYHDIAEADVDDNWNGIGLGLRFSSTLN